MKAKTEIINVTDWNNEGVVSITIRLTRNEIVRILERGFDATFGDDDVYYRVQLDESAD